jgi:hypothetical protein
MQRNICIVGILFCIIFSCCKDLILYERKIELIKTITLSLKLKDVKKDLIV